VHLPEALRHNSTMSSPQDTASTELAQLLGRVALKDQRAFATLYQRTSAHLLAVAYGVLHQREWAEDVLQEAFVNVWHAAASYNAQLASPMTWLINIVRNKAIDRARSGKAERASTQSIEALDEHSLQVADAESAQPQALLEQSLVQAHIHSCMQGLASEQRQALALAYYRGLVHAEIAQWLGAPLGTVKAWVRRGGDRLKSCLQAAGVHGA
jgi:RNA polymerase sigma-70 factor, ECF subfamily